MSATVGMQNEDAGVVSKEGALKEGTLQEVVPSQDVENGSWDSELPEGGLQAWLTVTGSWFVLFATLGYLYGFGVYQDYYTRIYLSEHSPSSISWIGSFQLMMPYLFGLFSGKLFDHGYFYILQYSGCVVYSVCLFMLSLAKPQQFYQIFLSQGLGMGIGLGLTFIPAISVLSHYFKRRRGLASGVALTGGSCGAIVFPIFLNNQLQKKSFGDSVRATAYLVLACLVVGCALMRTKTPAHSIAAARTVTGKDIRRWFTEGPYGLAMLAGFFNALGFYFPIIYLQLYAIEHNIDPTLAFYSLAILNGSGALSRVIANFASDVSGPFNLLIPCSLVVAATTWAMLGITNAATLIIVSVVYGIFSATCLPLSIIALTIMSKNPNEIGARTGLGIAAGSIGILVAAPIQGALLTSEFLWIRPIAFAGTMVIAATAMLAFARLLLARERSSQRV